MRPNDALHPLVGRDGGTTTEGITLRDWLAAQAMVGYLSASGSIPTPQDLAYKAYRYADAMILASQPTASPVPESDLLDTLVEVMGWHQSALDTMPTALQARIEHLIAKARS